MIQKFISTYLLYIYSSCLLCIYLFIHLPTMEYYSAIKKNKILPFFNNMDGSKEYYAKWSKSDTERHIPDFTHMCNLKNKTN